LKEVLEDMVREAKAPSVVVPRRKPWEALKMAK